jgi:hypothetical protein
MERKKPLDIAKALGLRDAKAARGLLRKAHQNRSATTQIKTCTFASSMSASSF